MFVLKENQVFLDYEYFVKFHICFVGIPGGGGHFHSKVIGMLVVLLGV